MTERNGNRVGWMVALVFIGIVTTGAGMAIRGDWLGSAQAQAVEKRVNVRIDNMEERTERRLERMEDKQDRIEEKIDVLLTRQ